MPSILQIELPTETVIQLEQVARQQQRSVDELVREMILHELPNLPSLPKDVEAELAAFDHLSDDVLWLVAQTTLTVAQQEELATLNELSQQRDLTVAERQYQQSLMNAYEHTIIRRTQAAALLKVRGHSVSGLTNHQAQYRRPLVEVMSEIYQRQYAHKHNSPTSQEVDEVLRQERDSWD